MRLQVMEKICHISGKTVKAIAMNHRNMMKTRTLMAGARVIFHVKFHAKFVGWCVWTLNAYQNTRKRTTCHTSASCVRRHLRRYLNWQTTWNYTTIQSRTNVKSVTSRSNRSLMSTSTRDFTPARNHLYVNATNATSSFPRTAACGCTSNSTATAVSSTSANIVQSNFPHQPDLKSTVAFTLTRSPSVAVCVTIRFDILAV